ncbi:MAG TPA: hypothetical protein DCZ01_13205 [Elusimicrobia bacterium]|nr:MAG: hypothetical protein A2X37_08275 [Elusimicrobia bacterium GWA2_66_18]OGR72013.1 MAG: hypothetical protein A2X40_05215 [Elusimicrobia bacterium GWC2_65_9]HAZ09441.1 hypothetical protein [Elusimicrobiota bacterium]
MINLFLAFATLAVPAFSQTSETLAARAGRFELALDPAVQAFASEDAFAGVGECGVLDIKTLRPFSLDEASALIAPCLAAVARKLPAKLEIQIGRISATPPGEPAKTGLILKTDLSAGGKAHRDLMAGLSRRENRLLGHAVRVLTRGEAAPASVSSVQAALAQCILPTVVRDLKTGDDFVKIYGRCLTRNADLKITEIRAGPGLTVNLKTNHSNNASVDALNGFVTVNAGKGPVSVMIVAYSAQIALP